MEPGKEFTVAEVEALEMCPDDGRVPHVPFGFMNDRWEEFKAQVQEGDKIVAFSSDAESWVQMCGREGYHLVRDKGIVTEIITLMN